MSTFEDALLRIVAPRLAVIGYEYDRRLQEADELFGFRKALGADVHAIVQFQRLHAIADDDFTVNLIRVKSGEVQARLYGGYAGALGARLGHVLWFVYQLRAYSLPDHVWAARDAADLTTSLIDVAEKLAQFGIPWLEDPQASKPWEMPPHHGDEFVEAVRAIMALELGRLGYRCIQQLLAGRVPYVYFAKEMPDSTHAFVEPQTVYSLDPNEFEFDVRLQRKANADPLAFGGPYRNWRSASLAQLVWQARDAPRLETAPVSAVKTLLWGYANQSELDAQLGEALRQIKRLGVPWLEETAATSKVIQ